MKTNQSIRVVYQILRDRFVGKTKQSAFFDVNLNEDNSISFCAGGIDTEEKRIELESFIKRNKKQYKSRDYKAW